jgi:hypothetical protein
MQHSLNAVNKLDKAEQVDSKSRSFLWVGIGIGLLVGGYLAALIGRANVIFLSTALLTALLAVVLINVNAVKQNGGLESVKNTLKFNFPKLKFPKLNIFKPLKQFASDIAQSLKNKTMFKIFISTTLIQILITAIIYTEIQPLFKGAGLGTFIPAIFFGVSWLQGILSNIASKGNILNIVKKSNLRNSAWIAILGSLTVFVLTHNPFAIIAFFVLASVFYTLSDTTESSYAARRIKEEFIGKFYIFKQIIDASLSAAFSLALVFAKGGQETNLSTAQLGQAVFAITAASFAIYLAAQVIYKAAKKRNPFGKKDISPLNINKLLQAA